jgi:capsular polysaccharide biosynthesis protein
VELSGYLAIIRRWWWTLIVAAWIAGLTGYLVAGTIPPTYESQAKVLVGPLNADTDTLRGSGLLVQTYAQYVTTREVLSSAIQELGLDLTTDEVAAATRATANDVTRILTIRVQAQDAEQASELANTLATELEQLTSSGLSRPEGLIQIIEFARPGEEPVAPQVVLLAMLAAAAGALIAVVVVLLLEYFGNTIRTREELAALAGAPVLGAVPAPSGDPPRLRDLVDMTAPNSRRSEPYRLMSAKIALGEGGNRTVLVTDTDWEGQAAVIGANLATALARFGREVVLIDGAGTNGTLTSLFGARDRSGLADLLIDGEAVPQRPALEPGTVALLPTGRAAIDGADPARLRRIIQDLTDRQGIAVLVGGPIAHAPLTLALAKVADTVVLVARRDRSRRDDVAFAAESLRLVGVQLSGVIMTQRPSIRGRRDGRRDATRTVVPMEVATDGVRRPVPSVRTKRRAGPDTRSPMARGLLADADEADQLSVT